MANDCQLAERPFGAMAWELIAKSLATRFWSYKKDMDNRLKHQTGDWQVHNYSARWYMIKLGIFVYIFYISDSFHIFDETVAVSAQCTLAAFACTVYMYTVVKV